MILKKLKENLSTTEKPCRHLNRTSGKCIALLSFYSFKKNKNQQQDNSKAGLIEKLYYRNTLKHRFPTLKGNQGCAFAFSREIHTKTTPISVCAGTHQNGSLRKLNSPGSMGPQTETRPRGSAPPGPALRERAGPGTGTRRA